MLLERSEICLMIANFVPRRSGGSFWRLFQTSSILRAQSRAPILESPISSLKLEASQLRPQISSLHPRFYDIDPQTQRVQLSGLKSQAAHLRPQISSRNPRVQSQASNIRPQISVSSRKLQPPIASRTHISSVNIGAFGLKPQTEHVQ